MPFVRVGVRWTRVITGGGVGVDIFRFDVAFESLASLGVSFYISYIYTLNKILIQKLLNSFYFQIISISICIYV